MCIRTSSPRCPGHRHGSSRLHDDSVEHARKPPRHLDVAVLRDLSAVSFVADLPRGNEICPRSGQSLSGAGQIHDLLTGASLSEQVGEDAAMTAHDEYRPPRREVLEHLAGLDAPFLGVARAQNHEQLRPPLTRDHLAPRD